ncbi:response regulator [Pseudodesulfovibrio sp.]|uniref:response regulator n=1 Tax=unclassified Pseudodesulfovibrio TaxID=2661612 RepID=UPI003B005165
MQTMARVLVVDDEERFRHTLHRLLEKAGHTVDEAPDGETALRKLGAEPFDVVLLDLKMPGLSGEDTFLKIRQRGVDVEVVCLTGHVSVPDATKLLERGAFDYLLKPAAMSDILQCVARAAESKRLRNEEIEVADLLGYGDK